MQYRALTQDLNEDGYPDAILQMNWCDKTGCVWLLFSRLTGWLSLPESAGGDQSPLLIVPERSQGWHDLVVQSGFQQWATLAFDECPATPPRWPPPSRSIRQPATAIANYASMAATG